MQILYPSQIVEMINPIIKFREGCLLRIGSVSESTSFQIWNPTPRETDLKIQMLLISKVAFTTIVVFFYFFSGNLLTHILYPLECRWKLNIGSLNIIDSNILHVIAFVFLGMCWRFLALLVAFGGEVVQVVIRHKDINFIDLIFNVLGCIAGVGLNSLWRKTLGFLKEKMLAAKRVHSAHVHTP